DTQALFDLFYPLVQIGAQAMFNEMSREGLDMDVSVLPSAGAIRKHLRSSVSTLSRTPDGVAWTTRQTTPGTNVGASAPVTVALVLPAVQAARQAARRTVSLNNMKQIGLALHVHHDATRAFPPAARKTADGKPGLSWRVQILPYIEEDALYREFHLDEPWDSDHNKKLLERMPATFRSPASTAPPGYTNYLGVGGDDGIFAPSEKGIRMAEVRDGTSNTVMTVEVSDAAAVPWTKPDDFVPNGMKPSAGLGGMWSGNIFLAGFADGSVRTLSASLNRKTLNAYFTKSGGEVVGTDEDAFDRGIDFDPREAPDVLEPEPALPE
ncbi:MAG: DUF1559 domain-containing protein, partial [Planctomycetales bacterium]|nr:DUF1559 domain-containing protein [Planctomycetales bacterium]